LPLWLKVLHNKSSSRLKNKGMIKMLTQKEKERIENKVKNQLYSGVISILRYTAKRVSLIKRLPESELLELAIKLEAIGLLEIPKIERRLMLERALRVLNWAEARAKTRIFSTRELLEVVLKIALKIEKR